jgi:imidazolonepropionase
MGKGDVRAVLLPGAWRTLRQTPPDSARMLRHGVKIAVGTDANPGTSPTLDLVLCTALAVRDAGLPVELALAAITAHAADAVGDRERGRLAAGGPADLVLWEADSPDVFAYALGRLTPRLVVIGGRLAEDRPASAALW